MDRFQRGTTTILVATTVVEVGVDVPEATIMIVEHAERSGSPNCTSCAAAWGAARSARPAFFFTGDRSAKGRGRGLRSCARPRTVFASPRRI